jgi:hypothetical protein
VVRTYDFLSWLVRVLGCVVAASLLSLGSAEGQDLEPRLYSNLPVGLNFLVLSYAYSEGGLATDASSPLKNADIKIHAPIVGYARSLDIFGMSGKFDAIVPSACLSGSAEVAGAQREREVCGLADPRLRLGINFYGAPALNLKEFSQYTQDTVVGATFQVGLPLGQYDAEKLVNIGTNRWFFKPEVGVSQKVGPVTLEFASAVVFYTTNHNYFGGQEREQDPLYSLQAHVVYPFTPGIWVALDGTHYFGGESTLNGVKNDDKLVNERFGVTLGFPLTVRHSVKLSASTGVYTRTGSDFDTVALTWQYRWGAGL